MTTTQSDLVDTEDRNQDAIEHKLKLIRSSPVEFAESLSNGQWKAAPHHRVIEYEYLRLFADPKQDLLVVKAPPRHGKSEALSRWFPTWHLCRYPTKRMMLATHTSSLSKAHSRWVRDRFERVSPVFGLRGADRTNRSVLDWAVEGAGMGGMLAAGVGSGSPTGRGCDVLTIDDYLRNVRDAQSETVRDAIWDWFRATITTRLEPGGKVIVLATQWHEDDLIGRLQSRREELGLNMRVVTLQAIREENGTKDPLRRQPGEALWPSRWPADALNKQRRTMGPYFWSCQYQGKPIAHEEQEFPEEYFSNIWCSEEDWPESFTLSSVYLDPSQGKDSKKGDYQALVFIGYHNGKYYVDSSIDRKPVPRLMRHMASWCKERAPAFVGIEANAFQDLLGPHYVEACEAEEYPVTDPQLIVNSASKLLRIRRLGGWLERRDLVFRHTASNEILISQLKNFPNAQHDDGPDATEGALRVLCNSVAEWNDLSEPEMSRLI